MWSFTSLFCFVCWIVDVLWLLPKFMWYLPGWPRKELCLVPAETKETERFCVRDSLSAGFRIIYG